jgi:hypothetical protein
VDVTTATAAITAPREMLWLDLQSDGGEGYGCGRITILRAWQLFPLTSCSKRGKLQVRPRRSMIDPFQEDLLTEEMDPPSDPDEAIPVCFVAIRSHRNQKLANIHRFRMCRGRKSLGLLQFHLESAWRTKRGVEDFSPPSTNIVTDHSFA